MTSEIKRCQWRILQTCLSLLVALQLCVTAYAAETTLKLDLAAGGVYNDNLRLRPSGQEQDLWGVATEAELYWRWRTQAHSFRLVPRGRAVWYPEDSSENRSDWLVNGVYGYTGSRALFNIDMELSRLDTLTSELESPEPGGGGSPGAGAGDVREKNHQDRIILDSDFRYSISNDSRLVFAHELKNIRFDTQRQTQNDYIANRLDAGWEASFSKDYVFRVLGYGSRFDPDNGPFVDTYGASVGFDYSASDVLDIFASFGAAKTDGTDETTLEPSIGFNYEGMRTSWRGSLGRSIVPNSTGRLAIRDTISLVVQHELSSKTRVGAGILAFDSQSLVEPLIPSANERDYARFRLDYRWAIARDYWISLEYAYTWQKYDSLPDSNQSNAIAIWFRYEKERRPDIAPVP